MENSKRITVITKANAPVERVWNAWNNPADVMQWNTAHPDWYCPASENDLRTGGSFKHRMEAKDGSMGFDFGGIYDKVEQFKEISYTMADGRTATTLFEEKDGQTSIQITFDSETQNDPELQKNGWQAILDNFARYVEEKK